MLRIGFIGTGNMGGALAKAASLAGHTVYLADRDTAKAEALKNTLTNAFLASAKDLVETCDAVFLGVKPQVMEALAEEIRADLAARKEPLCLISMAAGLCTDRIAALFSDTHPVIRIMPNTPVSVGEGMILYTLGKNAAKREEEMLLSILSAAGKTARIDEALIDAASAVSGCGPAFVFLFLEAFANAGAACGLDPDDALLYAKQTLLGAARLALESPLTPSDLCKAVCSPKGSTIEGVEALENGGLRTLVNDAVKASFKRTVELGK